MDIETLGKAAYNLAMIAAAMKGDLSMPDWRLLSEAEKDKWRENGLRAASKKGTT